MSVLYVSPITKFDFYHILPKTNENEQTPTPDQEKQLTAPVENKSAVRKAATQITKKPEQEKTIYFLQAASLKNTKEADKLKAQLILAGFDVSVNTVKKNHFTWHRVVVGPYSSKAQALKIKNKLKKSHVDSILVTDKKTI